MLHVATVVSLLLQLSAPSPTLVIVLVPFVPYVNAPLVGDKLTLPLAFPTVCLYVVVALL